MMECVPEEVGGRQGSGAGSGSESWRNTSSEAGEREEAKSREGSLWLVEVLNRWLSEKT